MEFIPTFFLHIRREVLRRNSMANISQVVMGSPLLLSHLRRHHNSALSVKYMAAVFTQSAPSVTPVAWNYNSMHHKRLSTSLATFEPLNCFGLGPSTHGRDCPAQTCSLHLGEFHLEFNHRYLHSLHQGFQGSSCYWSFSVVALKVPDISPRSSPMSDSCTCTFAPFLDSSPSMLSEDRS